MDNAFYNTGYECGRASYVWLTNSDNTAIVSFRNQLDVFASAIGVMPPLQTRREVPEDWTQAIYCGAIDGSAEFIRALLALSGDAPEGGIVPENESSTLIHKLAESLNGLDLFTPASIDIDFQVLSEDRNGSHRNPYLLGVSGTLSRTWTTHQHMLKQQIGEVYRRDRWTFDDKRFIVLGYFASTWVRDEKLGLQHLDRPLGSVFSQLLAEGVFIRVQGTSHRSQVCVTPEGVQVFRDYAKSLNT